MAHRRGRLGFRSVAGHLAVFALALAFAFPPVHADAPAPGPFEGTLGPYRSVRWQGSEFVNASTPSPEACPADAVGRALGSPMCDTFLLHVALGNGYWAANPGAVQIGIRWKPTDEPESEGEYDTLDLYVYDSSGALVASSVNPVQSSMGIASTAQVVNVPSAPDGDYKIVVVPFNVADRSYTGLVMVQSSRPPHLGALLPDLHALQPTNFKLAIGTLSLTRVGTDAVSCYPDETATLPDHPTRCLRFDAGHSNTGDGDFLLDIDLRKAQPESAADGTPTFGGPVTQQIQTAQSDGTVREVAAQRPAGRYQWHTIHGHIHYKNFAEYDLYAVDARGARTGSPVVSSKSDFCMIDVDDLWWGQPGNGPRDRHFPQCNTYNKISADSVTQRQGINRGWADIYTWDLPGQFINISDVPDGVYDVVNTVNPLHVLTEIVDSPASNRAYTRIRIQGNTITCISTPDAPCPLGTTPERAATRNGAKATRPAPRPRVKGLRLAATGVDDRLRLPGLAMLLIATAGWSGSLMLRKNRV